MQVRSLSPRDPRWDAYVAGHPAGQVVHLAGFQEATERVSRATGRHLALVDGDRVAGVLPLVLKRGPVSGVRLRSLPGMTAGPIADDPAGVAQLLAAARDVAERDGATLNVGARGVGLGPGDLAVGVRETPPTWVVRLDDTPEALRASWKRSSNVSRSLRKAEASGLVVRRSTALGDLRRFHSLFAETMRKHSTLPRPLSSLRLQQRLLGEQAVLLVVEHEGRMVAGGWYHAFNGKMVLVHNASRVDALPLRPNHLLYWRALEWGWDHGLREHDYGYTPADSSLGRFKAQWGAEPVPEVEYSWPPAGENAGVGPASASRTGELLQRLPLPAARAVGTVAFRYL